MMPCAQVTTLRIVNSLPFFAVAVMMPLAEVLQQREEEGRTGP